MFSAFVPRLQQLAAERKVVLHQKRLDRRRWAVRRDILCDANNRPELYAALEAAIAGAYTDYAHTVVLRAYFQREMEEPAADGTTLLEILEKTDVLARVANCLAPGFFECHLRRTTAREQERGSAFYEIVARFYANGIEPVKPPCTCVMHELTVGFCASCGGHGVRAIMNPEEEVED